jgi:hypothetical protein
LGIILAIVLSVIVHVRRHYAPHDRVVSWDADGHLIFSPPEPGTVSRRARRASTSSSAESSAARLASPVHRAVYGCKPAMLSAPIPA